ncbi:hypothetical protein RJ640_027943, partial [Escallonia rubra]
DGIRREVQTMTLIDHPNLLRAHCSFTTGHSLWVVMPYMSGGSCLHIMKSSYPEGFEEPVIATLLREVLKALVYLHAHGHIHRDVKAGNILIDSNGSVKLADFGVSACMFDTGDRQRSRNTFVGTPCWMAPEVMQQLHGYDFKADIWSFGITALELAHGHAPFSKYPPMKVLLMTLQNAPPGLDYERDKRFSKSFKEMVAACLVKDPKKRPSSEKLLKHHFFKHARATDYLARTILDGLSPLGDRFRLLKAKEADFLVQNKALYGDKEHLSQVKIPQSFSSQYETDVVRRGDAKMESLIQEAKVSKVRLDRLDQEYIRGISAWNFNLEDLKNQAALIQDYDDISNSEDPNASGKRRDGHDDVGFPAERLPPERANHSDAAPQLEDALNDIPNLENSLAAFPVKPLQALKGCFDVFEDDANNGSPSWKDSVKSDSERESQLQSSPKAEQEPGREDGENLRQSNPLPRSAIPGHKYYLSGSLLQDNILSPKKLVGDGDRDHPLPRYQPERNYSGPLQYRQKREINNPASVEDASEGAVVQCKGRFKVTSAEEEIVRLIKYVDQSSGNFMEFAEAGSTELSQIPPASAREKELHSQVIQLQQSIGSLVEELQRQKVKNTQVIRALKPGFCAFCFTLV